MRSNHVTTIEELKELTNKNIERALARIEQKKAEQAKLREQIKKLDALIQEDIEDIRYEQQELKNLQ